MEPHAGPEVVVLDLRERIRPAGPAVSSTGRTVLIDTTDGLRHHGEVHDRLLREEAGAVVCIAVGDGSATHTDVIRRPATLLDDRCALLWAADVYGVHWSPRSGTSSARAAARTGPGPTGLELLVAALRDPEVFDEVLKGVSDLPDRVAAPGVSLSFGIVDDGAIGRAWAHAIRELTETGGTDTGVRAAVARIVKGDGATVSEPAPSSRVAATRAAANDAIKLADDTAGALDRWSGLARGARAGRELGRRVAAADDAVADHRAATATLLDRIDGHLRLDRPPADAVLAAGAPTPAPAPPAEIAHRVWELVDQRLELVPPAALAAELRIEARHCEPHGCPEPAAAYRGPGPVPPAPAYVPPVGPVMIPPLFLAAGGTAWAAGPVGGAVVTVLSFALAWWLRSRWPVGDGERGARAAVLAASAVTVPAGIAATVAGTAAGTVLPLPVLVAVPVVGLALAITAAAFTVNRLRTARRVIEGIGTTRRRAAVSHAVHTLRTAISEQWWPSERRKLVSTQLVAAAASIERTTRALRVQAGAPAAGPAPAELVDTLRGDLRGILRAAVARTLGQAEPDGPSVLDAYDVHLRDIGVLAEPPAGSDGGARARLRASVWGPAAESLRHTREDEMLQLCLGRHLCDIATGEGGVLLRLGPERARPHLTPRTAAEDGSTVVWTANGDVAGAVRLMPVRVGLVRTEPAAGER